MANKVYWFKLPTEIKERLAAVAADPVTCLDDPGINELRDSLTWFRLPERAYELAALANEELNAPYTLPEKFTWFRLPEQIEDWLTYLEGLTVAVCS